MSNVDGHKAGVNQDPTKVKTIDRIADRFNTDRYMIYLAALLLSFFLFHVIKSIVVPPHVDEAYWWMQTKNLQAGYFFHPPFKVFELFVMTKIFGDTYIALRIGSIIFTTSSLYLIFTLSTGMFKDRRLAFYTVLVIALLPLTNYWMMLGHQEAALIFFSLLTIFLVWRAISLERKGCWYLAGISAGFMLLDNLRSTLIILAILIFLLTNKESRYWLRRKEPYLGFLIAVVMFIPTIIWYVSRDFEPLTYQLSNHPGFLDEGLIGYISSVITHIVKENIALSPFVYLFSLFGIIYGGYLGYSRKAGRDRRFQFLFCFAATIVIFFTITGGTPYWPFSGHIMALIAAGGAFPILLSRTSNKYLQRYWRPTFIGICVLIVVFLTLPSLIITSGDLIQNEWKPLAEKVVEVKEGMTGEDPYIAGSYYYIPSEIAYYQQDAFPGYTLAFMVYEHEVVGSGNSNYTPWVPLDELVGRDFIFIDAEMNPDDYDTPMSYWVEKLQPYFEHVDEPVIFEYEKWGNDIRRYYIFKAYGFKGYSPEMDIKGEIRDYLDSLSSAAALFFEG